MSADLQTLVGKILSDAKFAKSLAENPEKTLKEAGIEPTIDLIEALKGVDAQALQQLAANFGQNQAAV
ncbi:MAG: Os1348 family NHLP clan protein [Anaerolineae bacterium]